MISVKDRIRMIQKEIYLVIKDLDDIYTKLGRTLRFINEPTDNSFTGPVQDFTEDKNYREIVKEVLNSVAKEPITKMTPEEIEHVTENELLHMMEELE